jgi:hypothetical protein
MGLARRGLPGPLPVTCFIAATGRPLLLLALGLAGALAPRALAGELDERRGTLEQAQEDVERARTLGQLVQVRLYGSSEFVPRSDFDEFEADLYQPGGRVKLTVPVAEDAAVRIILRGAASLYDFRDVATDLFGAPTTGDPFDDLYSSAFELQGAYRTPWRGLFSDEERWTLLGEGFARSRWEAGAGFASGLDGGGALGIGYQIGDRLEVIAGAGVRTRQLGGGVAVFPVFELAWAFAERWTLRTRGRGGQLEYEIRDGLSAFLTGRLESRSYRLASRGPGVGEGRLRDRMVPVGFGVRWDLSESLELTATGGAVVAHQLRAQDEERETLGRVRASPAPFFSIGLRVRPDRLPRVRRAAHSAQRDPGSGSSSAFPPVSP